MTWRFAGFDVATRFFELDAGQLWCSILDTSNSWPSAFGSTLQVSMFVMLESMPLSVLRDQLCVHGS